MSNHYHRVLCVNADLVESGPEQEAARHWSQVYGNEVTLLYAAAAQASNEKCTSYN